MTYTSAGLPVASDAGGGRVAESCAKLGLDQILGRLREMVDELTEFGRREEKQFLYIGKQLAEFHGRARNVAQQAEGAIEALVKEGGGEALVALGQLLEGIEGHIDEILVTARHNEETLSRLIVQLEQIALPLQSLAKVVKVLLALSFSTRVESTHGQSGQILLVLADNLKELAAKINVKTDQVRDMMLGMVELSQVARERMQRLQEERLAGIHGMLRESRVSLQMLSDRRQQALDSANQLGLYSRDISEAIGEVVAAIQFHDITRQQVEHVRAALAEAGSEVAEQHRKGGDGVGGLLDICRMQAAQLRHTRGEIVSAVARIIRSLHDISRSVGRLTQQTRNLSGAAEEDGASFFMEMEPVITSVTTLIEQSVADNSAALEAVDAVHQAMRQLSRLLGEIELIGTEMKLIAFNAGITAAHNMERGAGLGVIADSIQSLSSQVLGRTTEFASGFHVMEQLVQALTDEQSHGNSAEALAIAGLNERGHDLVRQQRELNLTLIARLRELDVAGSTLGYELQTTADSITIHVDAGRLIDGLLATLDGIMGECQNSYTGEATVAAETMARLTERYTMQSERDVHFKSRAGNAAGGSFQPGGRRRGQDESLGDNIELF